MRMFVINADYDCYAHHKCPGTITIGNLQDFLKNFPKNMPVILRIDGGFGPVLLEMFGEIEFDEEA